MSGTLTPTEPTPVDDLIIDVAGLEAAYAAPAALAPTLPKLGRSGYPMDAIDVTEPMPFAARLVISLFAVLIVSVAVLAVLEAFGLQR